MFRFWIVRTVQRLNIDHGSRIYKFLTAVYQIISRDSRQGRRYVYSQFGEDVFLMNFFGTTTGQYVDVGSGHPVIGSNTFVLYQRGWYGISLDPIGKNIALARKRRPRDESILALCGKIEEEIEFWEYDSYEWSTTVQTRVNELAEQGFHPVRTHFLKVRPLSSLGLMATPQDPYVLSIDVEGAEMDVLRSNDWDAFTPPIIIAEEYSPPWLKISEINQFLNTRGYELKNYIGVSSIYVHKQSKRFVQ
jgi:FkbM family methyltransferase